MFQKSKVQELTRNQNQSATTKKERQSKVRKSRKNRNPNDGNTKRFKATLPRLLKDDEHLQFTEIEYGMLDGLNAIDALEGAVQQVCRKVS